MTIYYDFTCFITIIIAKADPGWAEQWKDPLFHILRDIADPSGVDPHYTLTRYGGIRTNAKTTVLIVAAFRCKDWYMGHSWASGITAFADGHNQEPTASELSSLHTDRLKIRALYDSS